VKKLWGILVCVLLVGGGSIAAVFYGGRDSATVRASTTPISQRQPVVVTMSDNNRLREPRNVLDNVIGFIYVEAVFDQNYEFSYRGPSLELEYTQVGKWRPVVGGRKIYHFGGTLTSVPTRGTPSPNTPLHQHWDFRHLWDIPTADRTPTGGTTVQLPMPRPEEFWPIPLIGFDVYGGYWGSHTALDNSAMFNGTHTTFNVDFGPDFVPVELEYTVFVSREDPNDSNLTLEYYRPHRTNTWAHVFERTTLNGETNNHPRALGPNLSLIETPPSTGRFEERFDDTGVFDFQITFAALRTFNYTLNMWETHNPLVTRDPANQLHARFSLLVRKQPPEFEARFPQNSNAFDSRVISIDTALIQDQDIYVEFHYLSGFNGPVQNARFVTGMATMPTVVGLPNFMEFRGVRARASGPENTTIPPAVRLGIREGYTAEAGLFGARATTIQGHSTWGLDPESNIAVRMEIDGFNNLNRYGAEAPTSIERLALNIGFRFVSPPPAQGFQHWGLVTGALALIALAGGFVLVNKVAISIQMRDIHKKRKKEEISEMKKYETMQKVREATGVDGRDQTDQDGIN